MPQTSALRFAAACLAPTRAAALAIAAAWAAAPLPAQSVGRVVAAIELRYNRLAAMRSEFEQSVEYAGRRRMVESGTLYLQRPGKMRWEYARPEGKIAVGDGGMFRIYNPYTNQVRQMKLDETADLRAPLAFLLGRMRLQRQFRNLRLETIAGETVLAAEGRSGREYFSRVEFAYDPQDFRLRRIAVYGRDDSLNVFRFRNETLNPALDLKLFEFRSPEGAEILPVSNFGGDGNGGEGASPSGKR